MLYSLFTNFVEIFSFLNVFKFLTVRTGLAMFTSMLIVFIVGTPFIKFFSSKQILDPIREDGPEDHIVKKIGTPTMGGLLILAGLFSGVLILSFYSVLVGICINYIGIAAMPNTEITSFEQYAQVQALH